MEKEQSDSRKTHFGFLPVILIIMAGLLYGCAKDGGVCVSNSGPITQQTRNIQDFRQIELLDNVSLILTSDTTNQLVVEAGKNIIGGIKTTAENGVLTIGNSNTCNWLRDYKKPINVYISARKIWRIMYNGSGDISTTDSLKLDSLTVEVWGGCGTIDLTLNIWKGNFSLNMGTVDFRLRGISAITAVYAGDYGLYDARDLKTGYTYITSKGSNDCYVMAINSLDATIGSIGNIYYKGNPAAFKATINGTGQVLPFQ
ncbi:MAG: head GIN domain-containing protein [Bacteroidota bacterium]